MRRKMRYGPRQTVDGRADKTQLIARSIVRLQECGGARSADRIELLGCLPCVYGPTHDERRVNERRAPGAEAGGSNRPGELVETSAQLRW